MSDHDSSGNSIWLGILVLLLLVLGTSMFLNWRQHSQAVAMQAEIDELHGQIELLEERDQAQEFRRALEALRAAERQREERGESIILVP